MQDIKVELIICKLNTLCILQCIHCFATPSKSRRNEHALRLSVFGDFFDIRDLIAMRKRL